MTACPLGTKAYYTENICENDTQYWIDLAANNSVSTNTSGQNSSSPSSNGTQAGTTTTTSGSTTNSSSNSSHSEGETVSACGANCSNCATVGPVSYCMVCNAESLFFNYTCVAACPSGYLNYTGWNVCVAQANTTSNATSNTTEGETASSACGAGCTNCATVGASNFCMVCDSAHVWQNYHCAANCSLGYQSFGASNVCVYTGNSTNSTSGQTGEGETATSGQTANATNSTSVTCGNVSNCADCVPDNGQHWCFVCATGW